MHPKNNSSKSLQCDPVPDLIVGYPAYGKALDALEVLELNDLRGPFQPSLPTTSHSPK